MGHGPDGWVPSMGGLSKRSLPVFTLVSEKTTENFERLGRQARPGFESGFSRLPVLSATTLPLVGLWVMGKTKIIFIAAECQISMNTLISDEIIIHLAISMWKTYFYQFSVQQFSSYYLPHQRTIGFVLKACRREVSGSILHRTCRPIFRSFQWFSPKLAQVRA